MIESMILTLHYTMIQVNMREKYYNKFKQCVLIIVLNCDISCNDTVYHQQAKVLMSSGTERAIGFRGTLRKPKGSGGPHSTGLKGPWDGAPRGP